MAIAISTQGCRHGGMTRKKNVTAAAPWLMAVAASSPHSLRPWYSFLAPSAGRRYKYPAERCGTEESIHTQSRNPLFPQPSRSRAQPLPSSSSLSTVRPLHGSSGYLQGAGDRWEPRRARPRRQGQRLPEVCSHASCELVRMPWPRKSRVAYVRSRSVLLLLLLLPL